MCYIVFIPRIQRPLRPASVFSMMMMMMTVCTRPRQRPVTIKMQGHRCQGRDQNTFSVITVKTASQLVTWSTRHSPKSYDELTGASNAVLSML